MNAERTISLRVNGTDVTAEVAPRLTAADFLRDRLGLTGTHVGCEHGVCGACTIQVDGVTMRSCILYAVQLHGADVRTVESLVADDGALHPIMEAMRECHGLQCGFCTPGFVMTIHEFLSENRRPDQGRIREAISGNLCRCTGYETIVAAVARADETWQRDVPRREE